MDIEAKVAKVNPMVVIKLRVATETIAQVKDDLKAGELPGVKFSDLFRLRAFLRDRKFGDLEIGLTGPVKSNEFLARVHDQYVAKGLTPNCSIEQVRELGGRVTLDLSLTDLGKAVLKKAKARLAEAEAEAEVKPKRVRVAKPKVERKPRAPIAAKVAAEGRRRKARVQKAGEIVASPAQGAAEVPAGTQVPVNTPAAKAGHPAWANQ